MQETRQNRIARLLQKELSLIFQSQTRAMHGVMVSVTRCLPHQSRPEHLHGLPEHIPVGKS